eukprot:204237-Pyramimonas_sp.AAC.1
MNLHPPGRVGAIGPPSAINGRLGIDTSPLQWGPASRNHMLFAKVSWVSSFLALRGDFPQPWKELLRSGCSRFPLQVQLAH